MKKLMVFIGLLISLSFISINAQDTSIWVEVYSEAFGHNVNGISVINENDIWFACDFSHVLHYDGTKAAAQANFPGAFANTDMYDVKFSGPDTGFVVGGNGRIEKTTDGGKSWIGVLNTQNYDDKLYSIAIIGNTIIAAGKKTFRSEDNGNTWSEMTMPTEVKKIVSCNNNLVALSSVFSDKKKVYTSSDIGNSWNIIEVDMYTSALALQKNGGYGITANQADIAFTDNYGQSWTKKAISNTTVLNAAVYFGNTIVLGGRDGVVLVSYDNGETWQSKDLPFDRALYSKESDIPDVLSLAVTENGTVWVGTENGGLYKTDQLTAVDIVDNYLPTDFVLSQNYPNPFNPSTTISYGLPNNTNVKLTIFNTLGQEIATLVNEYQYSGHYEINWQANNYSSGVYFYKLTAGKTTITKKMVLSK